MPKVTFELDMDEERVDFVIFSQANAMYGILFELVNNYFRSKWFKNPYAFVDKTPEDVANQIYKDIIDMVREDNISLDM